MFLRYNLFALIWACIILVTTLLPSDAMPPTTVWDLLSFDTFAHVFIFMVFTFLLVVGFTKQYSFIWLRLHPISIALLVSATYGIAIEIMQQKLISGRQGDIYDVASNLAGSVIGIVVFKLIYRV